MIYIKIYRNVFAYCKISGTMLHTCIVHIHTHTHTHTECGCGWCTTHCCPYCRGHPAITCSRLSHPHHSRVHSLLLLWWTAGDGSACASSHLLHHGRLNFTNLTYHPDLPKLTWSLTQTQPHSPTPTHTHLNSQWRSHAGARWGTCPSN